MTIGVVGRKSGMTRVFTDEGVSVPVTVVEVLQTASLKSKSSRPMGIEQFRSQRVAARPQKYQGQSRAFCQGRRCCG